MAVFLVLITTKFSFNIYLISPSEYRPQADDGIGYGDYPDMPNISGDMKSDYESYDYPSIKRNFGEPVHIHGELMTPEKVTHKKSFDGRSHMQRLLVFLTTVTVVFGLHFLLRDYKFFVPVVSVAFIYYFFVEIFDCMLKYFFRSFKMPKQYPRDVERGAQKHYVF
jgi:hypothetical protein